MTYEKLDRFAAKVEDLTPSEFSSFILHSMGYSVEDISTLERVPSREIAEHLIMAGVVLGQDAFGPDTS